MTRYNFPIRFSVTDAYQAVNPTDRAFILDAPNNRKNMTKKTSTKLNKSAWIRSQPASMSAAEVHAKARKEGIKMSIAQVYTARSTAKNKTFGKVGRPSKQNAAMSDLQRQFAALAVRIGTDDAARILAGLSHGAVAAAPKLAEAKMLAKPIVNGLNPNTVLS